MTWIGGKNVVVAGGRPGEPYDAVTWPLAMNEDGTVVAYAARIGDEQRCVSGGQVYGPYRAVGEPVLSRDGTVVAFAASDGGGWRICMNGASGPRYEWVGRPVLSPDGRSVAYAAQRRRGAGPFEAFVVANGNEGPAFDRVTEPVVARSGAVVAYGGRRDGRWFLVRQDDRRPVEGELASVFLDPSGRHAGYVREAAGKFHVVGPSGEGPGYDWVGWPAVTPRGIEVYLAGRGTARFLVRGRRETDLGEAVVWDLEADDETAEFGARRGRRLTWTQVLLSTDDSDH